MLVRVPAHAGALHSSLISNFLFLLLQCSTWPHTIHCEFATPTLPSADVRTQRSLVLLHHPHPPGNTPVNNYHQCSHLLAHINTRLWGGSITARQCVPTACSSNSQVPSAELYPPSVQHLVRVYAITAANPLQLKHIKLMT